MYFQIRKYAFLNIRKKLTAEKDFQVFLRLVNILFQIIQKEYEQKNCPVYFQIRKYAFLTTVYSQ